MGLSTAALRFLVREHVRKPFGSAVLTLGRQCVFATFPKVLEICREEGVAPCELPPGISRASNIPSWQGTPMAENTSDAAFFHALGAKEASALDYSDFEGAELVCDLNQPLPREWESRFDLVVDGGTIEHVFDVPQALRNVGRLLRSGGRVVHMSPANNYVNHGFFQVSPTLFLDYYSANGFADVRTFVAEQLGRDARFARWELFQVDVDRQPACMMSSRQVMVLCVAEKTSDSTTDKIPLQSLYQRVHGQTSQSGSTRAEEPVPRIVKQVLKRVLPLWVRDILRPYAEGRSRRKPWGCRRLGILR